MNFQPKREKILVIIVVVLVTVILMIIFVNNKNTRNITNLLLFDASINLCMMQNVFTKTRHLQQVAQTLVYTYRHVLGV